ncbi:MAG: hypothetical protein K8F91_23080 [Candidatus Obscuribacterales bacterium]|nr:hypothetical protein [Candidatus Obscuribacterales bacterium]
MTGLFHRSAKHLGQAMCLVLDFSIVSGLPAATIIPAQAEAQTSASTEKASSKYERIDFQLKGSKCVACIRRVVKKLKKAKGVIKTDISIFPPYWGVVVIDTKSTTFEDAFKKAEKEDSVTYTNLERKQLNEIPTLIIPKKNIREKD